MDVGSQIEAQAQNVWSLSPMSPIQWIYREWVKELGPSELDNGLYWTKWQSNTNKRCWCQWTFSPRRPQLLYIDHSWILRLFRLLQCSLSIFSIPFPWRVVHFIYLLLSHFHPPFVDYLNFYLSTCPISYLPNSLWVVVAKIALFRGILHINAASKVAIVHLMQWCQP